MLMSFVRIFRQLSLFLFLALLFSSVFSQVVFANDLSLGEEYSDYHKEKYSRKNSKSSNGSDKGSDRSLVVSTLLYIPNRVLDFIDIFRFDVGVGPAIGAVVRFTPNGQAGLRFLMPVSARVGLRGRKSPVFIEHSNEMGIGPFFLGSDDRKPTPVEVGLGADLFLAGAYVGVSIDSIFDFIGGFVGFDISEDDL